MVGVHVFSDCNNIIKLKKPEKNNENINIKCVWNEYEAISSEPEEFVKK